MRCSILALILFVGCTSSGGVLVGGGVSYGECLGYCVTELEFLEDDAVTLTRSSHQGDLPVVTNRGTLTSDGSAELLDIGAEIDGGTLEEVYGAPDAGDEGAAFVMVVASGTRVRSTYSAPEPPADLVRADAFVDALRLDISTCTSSARVSIEPGCTPR